MNLRIRTTIQRIIPTLVIIINIDFIDIFLSHYLLYSNIHIQFNLKYFRNVFVSFYFYSVKTNIHLFLHVKLKHNIFSNDAVKCK